MLRPGANPIIRWGDGGCGPRADLPGAFTTIMSLRSMRDGGVAFAAADPAIGIVNRQGEKRLFFGPPESAEMLVPSKFLVSSNGMRVCLAHQRRATDCFSVADRTLTSVVANRESSTRPPLTEGARDHGLGDFPHPQIEGQGLPSPPVREVSLPCRRAKQATVPARDGLVSATVRPNRRSEMGGASTFYSWCHKHFRRWPAGDCDLCRRHGSLVPHRGRERTIGLVRPSGPEALGAVDPFWLLRCLAGRRGSHRLAHQQRQRRCR